MTYKINPNFLNRAVKVLVVGAGGTGGRVLERLACLHRALIARGHPQGFNVVVADHDEVSAANIGRQSFYPCDIGQKKAIVLVNRINMALGNANWEASTAKLDSKCDLGGFDLVIGAVDNRAARLAILRGMEAKAWGEPSLWLDFGNRKSDGQVILGEVAPGRRKTDDENRLPHVGELYPELIDQHHEDPDEGPSCSLAEALEKQSLFINPTMADFGMNLLWQLFTKGELENHGVFVNLESMTATPLPVDPVTWARFGVVRDGKRHKVDTPTSKARKAMKAQNQAVTA